MQYSVQHTLRASAFVIAVLFSGAALAEQKQSSSDEETANCESAAALQFSLDSAQCAGYPSYSEMYGVCMTNAVNKYTQAFIACNQTSSAALTTFGGSGDTSGNGGNGGNGGNKGKPKGVKVTTGKSGTAGATTGGSSTGGGNSLKGKPHEFPKPPTPVIY